MPLRCFKDKPLMKLERELAARSRPSPAPCERKLKIDDDRSKRSLSAFRRRLASDVGDARAEAVWVDVDALIVKTMIAAQPALSTALDECGALPEGRHFYQLLGFDVMLDAAAKPWLLEVNLDPARHPTPDLA